MEVWQLDHPKLGLIEVERGFDWEFLEKYPDWPGEPKLDDDGEVIRAEAPSLSAGMRERAKARLQDPPSRMQIKAGGEVYFRGDRVLDGKVSLRKQKTLSKLHDGSGTVDWEKPHLRLYKNTFGDITNINFRQGPTVVEFIPPKGSRGEKRNQAMKSSVVKRVLFPLMAGMGKGGWALAVIVLGPLIGRLIGRIIDWLLSFVPEWEISWPQWPAVPRMELPTLTLPQMTLPVPEISWPSWSLPEIPAWLDFLITYSKVWVPVVIGLAIGISMLRNKRRSDAERHKWAAQKGIHSDSATQRDTGQGIPPNLVETSDSGHPAQ